jgi:large subunit ribosomal protein L9
MEVILLERIAKLGQMGEVVRVKDGFARNYLLPRGKALRATTENRTRFEGMKVELEARNLAAKGDAEQLAGKLKGRSLTVLRQASETGQLYGSVTTRDLASLLSADGLTVTRTQIVLNAPLKTIGLHQVPVSLHADVEIMIAVTVARNADEAARIARGEDLSVQREEEEAPAGEDIVPDVFFDPGAAEARRTHEAAGTREESGEPEAEAGAP